MARVRENVLRIDLRVRGEFAILELRGRLDIPLERDFIRRVERLEDEGFKDVVVDASGLEYLSSRGVSAFIAVIDGLRDRGGDLKLAGVPAQAGLILDRLGVSRLVQRFDTVEGAVAAFDRPVQDYLAAGGLDVFVSSDRGRTFHASHCVSVRRIRVVLIFPSKKEAREAGRKPCRRCC